MPQKPEVFTAWPIPEKVCPSPTRELASFSITHVDPSAEARVETRCSECCFNCVHSNHTYKSYMFMKSLNTVKIHSVESESLS